MNKTKIGLEVHIVPRTQSKLFSACPVHATEPNTAVDPVSLGLPGSKPVLNKKAVDSCIKIALALNCTINKKFFFSRKTYFYPDMAKNYQITQYEVPIGQQGYIMLRNKKQVKIERVHLEEDPAALVHASGMHASNNCMVDYNRSGVPLVEVVTAPDMETPKEAREFLDTLVLVLSYLEVFDEKNGLLKADCNISVNNGARVEIKNVNGLRAVEKALAYELKRQQELVKKGKKVQRETRSFDEKIVATCPLRDKETEEDYGYIFDPDLPLVELPEGYVAQIKKSIPELAEGRTKKFVSAYHLDQYTAEVLAGNFSLSTLFMELVKKTDAKIAAAFLTRELLAILNRCETTIERSGIKAQKISPLLTALAEKKITEKNAKEAMIAYVVHGTFPMEYIKSHRLIARLDEQEAKKIIKMVLRENPKALSDYERGEKKAFNFLLGQVMAQTKGTINPKTAQLILKEQLQEYE